MQPRRSWSFLSLDFSSQENPANANDKCDLNVVTVDCEGGNFYKSGTIPHTLIKKKKKVANTVRMDTVWNKTWQCVLSEINQWLGGVEMFTLWGKKKFCLCERCSFSGTWIPHNLLENSSKWNHCFYCSRIMTLWCSRYAVPPYSLAVFWIFGLLIEFCMFCLCSCGFPLCFLISFNRSPQKCQWKY